MMTLRTIIGSFASESKEYVDTGEGGAEDEGDREENEEEEECGHEHTPDIDLRPSAWLSACTLVGKPLGGAVGHLRMGSCFDFGLHSASTTTTNYNRTTVDDDVIRTRLPSSPSLTQLPEPQPQPQPPPPPRPPSSERVNYQPQEQEQEEEEEGPEEEEVSGKVEREERSMALEKTYVYDVYDQIAPYFRESRNRTWPKINQFLMELEPGSLICDAGCGSGKYLDINPEVYPLGLDRCQTLTEVAKERGHEVVTCDILALPFREESFDAAISISVVHHLATTERRVEALKELARVLRIGGRLVITVWAMEQRHRKFESQDVLVPWHKPVRVSSEDQTSIEKDMTSTTTNSDEDILNYHAYTSGSEPSVVLSYPARKRHKFRESWMSRHRFGGSNRSNYRSSSQSSSDLSSPNESCYSFLRRALQKLSWGSTENYKTGSGHSAPWFNPGSNSLEHLGFNTFGNELGYNVVSTTHNSQVESRNRLNAELDKQDSLDSNENAEDIPIELYDVDGDQLYQVPQEVSRLRQRRGTSSSDNNVTFKRRISQSFERTASLKDTVLSRRRNKPLKARLKRSASTDSPNSHAVTHKSRSLSDLLSLFSATFLQYSRKTSQDTTSGSSSSFTKHSSTSSVDSKGSRTMHISKSNIFTLAKVEEDNENYNANTTNNNNNVIISNNKNNDTVVTVPTSDKLITTSGNNGSLFVSLVDETNVRRTPTPSSVNRKVRPRSLILNREQRVSPRIPRTLSVEDYQNGNHILIDFDSSLRFGDHPKPQLHLQTGVKPDVYQGSNTATTKTTRDMSTQFDYCSPREAKPGDDTSSKRDDDDLSSFLRFNKTRDVVDSRFIDRIIDRDHLFPCHSMPNLLHVCPTARNRCKDYKKRDSFILLSSKAKVLMELAPRNTDGGGGHARHPHPLNIKGFRRLSLPCMQLCSTIARDECDVGDNFNFDNCNSRRNSTSSRWASLLRRHSSFSVVKQCHHQHVIRHSHSTGDSTLADSGNVNVAAPSHRHSNSKVIIKEDSLQSDTSVDSDDSVASVIAVNNCNVKSSPTKPNSICNVMKSSSKEGSDTSFDSEESCVSVIANEAVNVKQQQQTTEDVTEDVTQPSDIDIKYEKYMDACESLVLDSIFYVNIVHQPEMETMMAMNDSDDDFYLPGWTTFDTAQLDYDIVGMATVEYRNFTTKDQQSVAETCWLDSSSSCKSCDHDDDDLLERQLQLDINYACSDTTHRSSSIDGEMSKLKSSSGRLFDAAVDVANSLQSAVTVAFVSNQKCNLNHCNADVACVDTREDLGNLNQPLVASEEVMPNPPPYCSLFNEPIAEDDNEMNNSFKTNDTSMSISREEADFCINEGDENRGAEERDSFEESQWRVREDVINGNVSQAHLRLFQKMLRNVGGDCPEAPPTSRPYVKRRLQGDQRSHRRKSDSEAQDRTSSSSSSSHGTTPGCSEFKSAVISRGRSLEFYVLPDQSQAQDAGRPHAIVPVEEESDYLTKSVESSDDFERKDQHNDVLLHHSDDETHKTTSKSHNNNKVTVESPTSRGQDDVTDDSTNDRSSQQRKKQRQDTLSVSTSEDSILSGSENCGSTTHHRYYHVFREGELDYLIENYVENLHIISSYYDHSNWCVVAEKVQVWKI